MSKESCEQIAEKVLDHAYDLIEETDSLVNVTERGLLKSIAEAIHRREVEAFNQGIETAAKTSEEFNSINVEMDGISCITEAIRNKLKKEK